MIVSRLLLLSVLISGLYMAGCKGNDGTVGPSGPAGPSLTGDLVGFVYLVDTAGVRLSDARGVKAYLENTPDSTFSDSTGRWVLRGISSGSYTLTLTKAGYSMMKDTRVQFVGGGTSLYGSTTMFSIPLYVAANLSADTTGGKVVFNGTFVGPLPGGALTAIIYISRSPTVSSNPANFFAFSSAYSYGSAAFNTYGWDRAAFRFYGISPGTTLYAVAYSSGTAYNGYTDIATGNFIVTTLNPTPSNLISFVTP